MYLPVGVCVDDANLDLFKDYVNPAFQAERLLLVSNQMGANKVAVYAMGHLKPGKTVQDIAAGRANATLGMALATTAPSTAPAIVPGMPEPEPPRFVRPRPTSGPATNPAPAPAGP